MENLLRFLSSQGCNIDVSYYLCRVKDYSSKEELQREITDYITTFKETNPYGIQEISVALGTGTETYFYNAKENTVYDLASITKLFTLKAIYDLEKEGKIAFHDSLCTYLDDFPSLRDYTIMDAIKMLGLLETDGKLSDTKDNATFLKVLKSVQVKEYGQGVYADIGFILLGQIIEKITGKDIRTYYKETIFDKYNMVNTCFLPKKDYVVLGNGNDKHLPHDFKTRVAHGMTGAAGIFSNVQDLVLFSEELRRGNVFNSNFLEEIYNYTFLDTSHRNRSLAGIYKKSKEHRSYVPKEFSDFTLAHQGFTGAVWVCDLKLSMTQILLFDAIENGEKQKHPLFFEGFYTFRDKMSEYSILLYLKDYLEKRNQKAKEK